MSVYIYNSLTRTKELFSPLAPPQVTIYVCGVTVYDACHLGHARSLFIFDVIRRYLSLRGFKVTFVRNITDIDDKIITRANELKVDWQELVNTFIARYYEDLASLGLAKADIEPRATENIPYMVKYIQALIEKGYAYDAEGDVYFNVRAYGEYGKLSGQSIDQMETGVRKEVAELKRDPLDFALWKRSKPGEPSWESPWGPGRPGWHIECSVMSQRYLKTDTLDIHAGGRDLIFPHHENEIAQSEALTGVAFAKYWLHGGLLTINGQKMAKSSGNFITIKDFIGKYGNTDFLKFFFLSAHYSHPIDFTHEKIEEARRALERIAIVLKKSEEVPDQKAAIKEIEAMRERFLLAMDDDFNTPQALAVVFELVNLMNKHIEEKDFIGAARRGLLELLSSLGISADFSRAVASEGGLSDKDIKDKIEARNAARQVKNFALSDQIRKELEAAGVILEDIKGGTSTWRRKL